VPNLVDAVDAELTTDFAILQAGQPGVAISPRASFATSTPGFVSLECGNKYARVHVRAERWDARPPWTDGWEDFDELPFEEVPAAGRLVLSGFDPGDVGLDIDGLARGRVQVAVRGRHRYGYSSAADVDVLAPEEWLLRLYPFDGSIDPLAGGPRRIAGEGGIFHSAGSPWQAAARGFTSSGWAAVLGGSHGFYLANLALVSAEAPMTRLELAARMARWMPPWEVGGPDAESTEVPPRPGLRGQPDPLALLSGHEPIDTIGDAIDAMVGIGLLLIEDRAGQQLLIPNPSPVPAWEHVGMTGETLVWARSNALASEYRQIAGDITCAVLWLGEGGLLATPRSMAIRWSTTVGNVVGGIRMLGGSGRVTSDRELGFDVELDADETLALWPGTGLASF
jgi:hypothetical protein